MAAPETFVIFMTIDVGLAVEVLVFSWLAASSGALRGIKATMLARLPRRMAPRARRGSRPRRQQPAANDDEPAPALTVLLAA